jgi:hypothetical protein
MENHAEYFDPDQIIDKSLYAKRPVIAYTLPQTSAPVHESYNTGNLIGVVYSYVQKGKDIFWMFEQKDGQPYYVKHSAGAFSISALKDQGAMTEKEKAAKKEKENETVSDVLKGSTITFIKSAKWILIAAIFILVALFIYKHRK